MPAAVGPRASLSNPRWPPFRPQVRRAVLPCRPPYPNINAFSRTFNMSVKDHPMSRPRQTTPTATTPRVSNAQSPAAPHYEDASNVKTPTRDTFAGISGQRPLPSPSSLSRRDITPRPATHLIRHDSGLSPHLSESSDTKMDDVDEVDESDNESTASDATPSKKKKSQRFFCTEFPPCQLSFTRSEHLARHIRYVNATFQTQ